LEHLDTYLAADGIDLSGDVLDRIDEVVPPWVTINAADNLWNMGTTALDTAPAARHNGYERCEIAGIKWARLGSNQRLLACEAIPHYVALGRKALQFAG